jgi:CRISPR/Cas system CSM-associated protein Csm3 (group 7 of RAMP superfamily)
MSEKKKDQNKIKAVEEPTGLAALAAIRDRLPKGTVDLSEDDNSGIAGYTPAWAYPDISSQTELDHKPNPFDFVPFPEGGPKLFDKTELDSAGEHYSGYLEMKLTAKTPIHIVGKQDPEKGKAGTKIAKSHFYREGGVPCIPGSSIKGMLRSFIEALTNGWVSQAQEKPYEKIKDKRFIGFSNYETVDSIRPAIPHGFVPEPSDRNLDVASYLFGYVDSAKKSNSDSSALKGKVIVEDALCRKDDLQDHELIDIEGDAFMGGPHPSATSWWYLRPKEVRKRNVSSVYVGEGYWGRKFYYHQAPKECIAYYADSTAWKTYKYKISCLQEGKSSTFRLYINRVPRHLLGLLCMSLCPGDTIRHKLGYGRAYGYGSVEFEITGAQLRKEKKADWPEALEDMKDMVNKILEKKWLSEDFKDFIHPESLNSLARILGWVPGDNIVFTYPPFTKTNFKTPVTFGQFKKACTSAKINQDIVNGKPLSPGQPVAIVEKLWHTKKTIHLPLYQARAKGYSKIKARRP